MSGRLPLEIVEEILHRLPVKSIVKFTTVCRAWKSLITDQNFISDHLNRTIRATNGKSSFFIQFSLQTDKGRCDPDKDDFYSLYSPSQPTEHLFVERFPLSHLFRSDRYTLFAGTCNGLVCSADYSLSGSATIILIWNPLLRKYVVLPKPIMTSKKRNRQHRTNYDICLGFGFDSRNNDYKVIRIMTPVFQQATPHVQVYSLSSHSWRSIPVRGSQFYFCYNDHEWLPPVFVNGAVHWVAYRPGDLNDRFILSFNVTEETFGELRLPQQSSEESVIYISRLFVVEGGHSLGVAIHCLEEYHRWVCRIWVMKEYGVAESWTEILHCDHDSDCYGRIRNTLALTSSGKVVMRINSGAIVLVDPIKKLAEPLEQQEYFDAYAGCYVESLSFINKDPNILSF